MSAVLVVAVFAAALSALLRYSVLEFVPGSLQAGGLTVANFTGIMSRQYLGAVWDTVLLSAATISAFGFMASDTLSTPRILFALGLPSFPAVVSLAVFFFLSTLVEPLLLAYDR